MRKTPRSIDGFLALIQDCASIEALFSVYAQEMENEGYHNIVFARIDGRPDQLEVPFANVPENDARLYFEERMWENDPILAASQTARMPFTWIDEMMRKSHAPAAHRVMELSAAIGVQGGLTMPFHGPGGKLDIVSLSMRDKRLLDAARIGIVNMKTYAVLQRHLMLETAATRRSGGAVFKPHGPAPQQAQTREPVKACTVTVACAAHPQHGECVGVIDDEECRALVIVDIAWRRYSAGLLDLNKRVPDIIGDGTLRHFMDRGLIEEEPDDMRFEYFFRPSPIGQSHIKACPCVMNWRDEIWSKYVEVHERPID